MADQIKLTRRLHLTGAFILSLELIQTQRTSIPGALLYTTVASGLTLRGNGYLTVISLREEATQRGSSAVSYPAS